MQLAKRDNRVLRRTIKRKCLQGLGLLLGCWAAAISAHGRSTKSPSHDAAVSAVSADQLAIKIKDDKLTLAIAKAPQVYLLGKIDADAPHRFEALMRTWKIPTGSDIYLDSPGGDVAAGMALGRLFRAGSMVTHLGAPRRTMGAGSAPEASQCVDACVYAYVGGLYRWAPTGTDRIGLHPVYAADTHRGTVDPSDPTLAQTSAYFKDMGINPAVVTPALMPATAGMAWLTPDQMLSLGFSNNGRLPLAAVSQVVSGQPLLTFNQIVRGGQNRITLSCKPEGVTLTSYYMVGAVRARELVERETRSYFDINHEEVLPLQTERAHIENQAIVFSRPLSLDQLNHLLSAYSLGAWIRDKSGAVRYGYTIGPVTVKNSFADFYARCQQIMPTARATTVR